MSFFDNLKTEADLEYSKINKLNNQKEEESILKMQLEDLYKKSENHPSIIQKRNNLFNESKLGIKKFFKDKGFQINENDHIGFSEINITSGTLTIKITAHNEYQTISLEIKDKQVYDEILIERSKLEFEEYPSIKDIKDSDTEKDRESKLDVIKVNINTVKKLLDNIENINYYLTLHERRGSYSNVEELLQKFK